MYKSTNSSWIVTKHCYYCSTANVNPFKPKVYGSFYHPNVFITKKITFLFIK